MGRRRDVWIGLGLTMVNTDLPHPERREQARRAGRRDAGGSHREAEEERAGAGYVHCAGVAFSPQATTQSVGAMNCVGVFLYRVIALEGLHHVFENARERAG